MEKERIYKFLFLLLVISIPAGSYLFSIDFSFGTIYGYRVVLISLGATMLFYKDLKFPVTGKSKYFTFFLLSMFVYGLIQLNWVLDLRQALKALFNISLANFLWIILWNIHHKFDWFWKNLVQYWVFGLTLILLISFWEVYTFNHLAGNFAEKLKTFGLNHFIHNSPVATFDNPNLLATYLTLSVSILLFLGKGINSVFRTLLISFSLGLIFKTDARLCQISLIILFIFFFISNWEVIGSFFLKEIKKVYICSIIAAIFFIGVFSYDRPVRENYFGDDNILEEEFISHSYFDKFRKEKSYNVRKNLMLNGLDFTKQSDYLGIGPGQFSVYVKRKKAKYETGNHVNPHSMLMEMLSEYGLILFFPFIAILTYLFISVLRYWIKGEVTSSPKLFFISSLLVIYPVISNSNSAFLYYPLNWFILSVLFLGFLDFTPKIKR